MNNLALAFASAILMGLGATLTSDSKCSYSNASNTPFCVFLLDPVCKFETISFSFA